MELAKHTRRLATAAVVGYVVGRVVHTAAVALADRLLRSIDEALADLDFDDWDDQPATGCHAAVDTDNGEVRTIAGAVLHNREHGFLPMAACFHYRIADPLAVTVTFTLDIELPTGQMVQDQKTWTFALDLLSTAMAHADSRVVGEGDVRVQYLPDRDVLIVHLVDAHTNLSTRIDIAAEPVACLVGEATAMSSSTEVNDAIERLLDGTWKA